MLTTIACCHVAQNSLLLALCFNKLVLVMLCQIESVTLTYSLRSPGQGYCCKTSKACKQCHVFGTCHHCATLDIDAGPSLAVYEPLHTLQCQFEIMRHGFDINCVTSSK